VVMATSAIHKKRMLPNSEVGPLDALGETTATFCGARSRTVAQLDDSSHPERTPRKPSERMSVPSFEARTIVAHPDQ
jgi:hypothetical protein